MGRRGNHILSDDEWTEFTMIGELPSLSDGDRQLLESVGREGFRAGFAWGGIFGCFVTMAMTLLWRAIL